MNMRKKTIKIATFNVLNLVLPEVKYYGKKKYSQNDYDKKIDWISSQLKDMNADIIGFQEVFHGEALQDVIDKSGIYKNGHVILANQTGDQPRVAIVSRFPIADYEIYDNFPEESILDVEKRGAEEKIILPYDKFSRPILRADIKVHEDYIISVYVVHLKSKRPIIHEKESRDNPVHLAKGQARSLIIRASESAALRAVLSETLVKSERPVIVMGDVNDGGQSVTTNMISGESPHRRLPKEIKKNIWDSLLYHVKDLQARRSYHDFYYTHIHNGHYDSLDHIMVSQELVSENPQNIGRIGYVSLYNDHLYDATLSNEKTKNWKSDHGQVAVTIELNLERIEHKLQEYKSK